MTKHQTSEDRGGLAVLLLCDYRTDIAATVGDHIDAFSRHSAHRIYVLSILGDLPDSLDLERFDVVVVHYSLVLCMDAYVSAATRRRLAAFSGLKVVFLQDEYRHVERTLAAIREIGARVLYSCIPAAELPKVYGNILADTEVITVLTGYVPERLKSITPPRYSNRSIDVGYRGRRLPAWLGELGQEKARIGERFVADARKYGLICDISSSEEDRLYGEAWIGFLSNCKAILGVESGASVFDLTGEIEAKVNSHLIHHPAATFEELRALYFKDHEARIVLNQISPRCFEAACLRTLMILYPGEYSGLLQPWRHYVPLAKDHSNMDEVVAVLRNPAVAEEIIERTHAQVVGNPSLTFRAFVGDFDDAIRRAYGKLIRAKADAYEAREFEAATRPVWKARLRRWRRDLFDKLYRAFFGRILKPFSVTHRETLKLILRRVAMRLRRSWRLVSTHGRASAGI